VAWSGPWAEHQFTSFGAGLSSAALENLRENGNCNFFKRV